ncbi:MAG: substrate-binding domain-containing protein [Desulfosarcina sp.]|nr:substrate-binding domain-containing protein [Desulfosarcina sp.]MBC2743095.1 substrate-binding domain-containing protein [Desulfosarcina sp.]MBC2766005.1 solute-binding protein [Desulfosarcina sp.]
MKKAKLVLFVIVGAFLAAWVASPVPAANAEETLKFYCSNQVYKAFGQEQVEAFSHAANIKVDVKTASSGSCLNALMNGYCDIAATARAMYRRHRDYGFLQVPLCRDPIAVIISDKCGVDNLTEDQLQNIFSGEVKNWKQVGGPDLAITVIVPSKNTAANKNFRRQVMKHKDIEHDFMAHDSTMAIAAVAHFPCGAVSFISQGAAAHDKGLKVVRINGKSPADKDYPYFQTFYYVTRAEPSDAVKKFLDFSFTDEAKKLIKKYGMVPLGK